jgi:hypothetical protein
MGQFLIKIAAIGTHGCERQAQAGGKLFKRCCRLDCVDCLAYDFVNTLRQKGVTVGEATFTHWPGTKIEVVDDLVRNQRKQGQF